VADGIHVLVVDDSAVVRQMLTEILVRERSVTVTVAANPLIARDKMLAHRPSVIVLDLEMPGMDGLSFLDSVMATDPIPVVVCSGLAARGTETALRAMEAGAVAVVAKPKVGVRGFLHDSALMLRETVVAAASAQVRPRAARPPSRAQAVAARGRAARPAGASISGTAGNTVVAIGASTGGTEALRRLLEEMPPDAPGLVVVQHMPEGFTRAFAERLDRGCRIEVKEAEPGDRVVPGRALVAPGNRHLLLRSAGGADTVELCDGPLVSRHRPSVDVLFRSVAAAAGPRAVGVILTGMGDDGADGLLEMKRAGAVTLAQDEASCVVFGMPKAAIERGGVDRVVGLDDMATLLLREAASLPGDGGTRFRRPGPPS